MLERAMGIERPQLIDRKCLIKLKKGAGNNRLCNRLLLEQDSIS
jgi:hypothetical protein